VKPICRAFVRFLSAEEAHAPVEYASILALIILTVDLSVTSLGSYISNPFWTASNALATQNTVYGNRTGQGGTSPSSGSTTTTGYVQVSGS
jgi:hypothetical protein